LYVIPWRNSRGGVRGIWNLGGLARLPAGKPLVHISSFAADFFFKF
jgi:hypothetical protein